MRWLVTVKKDIDLESMRTRLAQLGASSVDAAPIPIGDDEIVLQVEATASGAEQLSKEENVVAVDPSSDYTLY